MFCMVTSHKNTLTIALIIPVNKGRGTAERYTSFNHCVILLTTFYENADHAYRTDSHDSCKKNLRKQSLTESVDYLWLLLYLAVILHLCMLV